MLALALGIPFAALAKETNPPVKLKVDNTPINRELGRGNSYSSVVKKASPSVVNIYSTKTVKAPRYHQFFEDPMFDRFFGDGGQRRRGGGQRSFEQTSLGSGVIVTEDGYILTNNHVVEGADTDGVEVALGDGKQKFKAKVIGNDPQTDLAVLKVDAKNLPAITIADSDRIEVGDVVLAIGNPFNVGQSVTMGIVSAFGRGGFGITDYEDFIQTDAPINPGNSGGALVDTDGRLIGINQSIVSRSGGNAGVGFAVPVNQARIVLERLVADGTVRRGFLGVLIQPVTPELAKAFDLPADTRGALVGGVSPETPAAKAGIKEGDVITEVNGRKANDSQQVRLMISQLLPGTKAALKILRDGKDRTVTVTLGELSKEGEVVEAISPEEPVAAAKALKGVELSDLTSVKRREHGVPNHVRGALVVSVEPDSKAAAANIRPGDVIQEVNRQLVESAEDVTTQLRKAGDEPVLLRVWSRGEGMSGSRFVTLEATRD
jgi:serine protease Do